MRGTRFSHEVRFRGSHSSLLIQTLAGRHHRLSPPERESRVGRLRITTPGYWRGFRSRLLMPLRDAAVCLAPFRDGSPRLADTVCMWPPKKPWAPPPRTALLLLRVALTTASPQGHWFATSHVARSAKCQDPCGTARLAGLALLSFRLGPRTSVGGGRSSRCRRVRDGSCVCYFFASGSCSGATSPSPH